ncbi:cell division protein DivIVA, partial [Micromonospora chalcea]
MPQQQSSPLAFFDNANSQPDFTVGLRGYNTNQVDDFIGRLTAALSQSEQARAEAEQRMNDAQRRLRQAEQRQSALEQKLTETNKQLEENSRPTLSGLGTRVEQILRLAEEQANDHRNEAKRESEGILSAARLEAREITDKARAEAAAMKATAEREAGSVRTAAGLALGGRLHG